MLKDFRILELRISTIADMSSILFQNPIFSFAVFLMEE